MKMAVCCTLPTTILRRKNSGVGDTVNSAGVGQSLTDNNGPYIELMTGILPITSLILPRLMLTKRSVLSSISCLIILWAWCKMPPAMR